MRWICDAELRDRPQLPCVGLRQRLGIENIVKVTEID